MRARVAKAWSNFDCRTWCWLNRKAARPGQAYQSIAYAWAMVGFLTGMLLVLWVADIAYPTINTARWVYISIGICLTLAGVYQYRHDIRWGYSKACDQVYEQKREEMFKQLEEIKGNKR